jgi:hypothetical protein
MQTFCTTKLKKNAFFCVKLTTVPNPKDANRLIDQTLTAFSKAVSKAEPLFAKLIIDWVGKFGTYNGNILNSAANDKRLSAFEDAVKRYLIRSGYTDAVSGFLQKFDPLSDLIREIHKDLSDLDITKAFINPYKKFAIKQVSDKMIGQGLVQTLVQPVQNELFLAVKNGVSLQDVIKSLEAQLVTTEERQGVLKRNALQASRDALGQYEGTVNEGVRKAYKLDAILYIGSLVKDSRPQCERWVNYDKNGKRGLILIEELEEQIAWAENNGTGFIVGTTPANFLQNRGGYNCRHTAYPVRSSLYIKPK